MTIGLSAKACLTLMGALSLSACATAPSYISPDAYAEAHLRDLRNAEARLKLARTTLDLDDKADADDLREYYTAREELSRLRGEYGPTETGYNDLGWHPAGVLDNGVIVIGTGEVTLPRGFNNRAAPDSSGYSVTTLSGLPAGRSGQ